jgi:Fic family protein
MKELLKKIEAKKRKLDKLLKNKENVKTMQKWLKAELSYTSNAIEGNTLTRRETYLAIEENITSGSKPINDYIEAINHAKAFDFVIEAKNNKLPINEKLILEIHRIILRGIDDKNAGFYRNVRVYIAGSNTILPNPLKVPDYMKDFDKWLQKTKETKIFKAIEAHYKLVSIHPFIDGNGRTARILMNLILMNNNYAPIIIRPIDRKRYLNAIEIYQTKGIKENYIKFMLNALSRSFTTIIDLLDKKNGAETLNEKLMTIAKFAKLAGLRVSTIRYWVKEGKLKPISYSPAGYMLFSKIQVKDIKKNDRDNKIHNQER